MDGGWTLASQVTWQVVAWPLAVLLLVRSVRGSGRSALPSVAVALLLVGQALAVLTFEEGPGLESSAWFLLVTSTWFVVFPVLCATYPDGRFVPRWFVWPTLAYISVTVADLALGGSLRSRDWWEQLAFSQLLMLWGQVHRYRRRATTAERESVRWAILGVILEVEAFMLIGAASGGTIGEGGDVSTALANLAALPIPVAFAVGLLRPRLAKVDTSLRLVVGLTAAAVVLGSVYATTTAVARLADADAVAAGWWGAAAVALLTVPAARASWWFSERVVYRGRSTPDQAVARLGAELDRQPDAASVPQIVLQTLTDCLLLDGAALRGDPSLSTTIGEVGPRVEEFPVAYRGEDLGRLRVPPRRGESELTARDRQVVHQLTMHAAPALHGALALAELRRAHARLLHTREEERRTLRRDLHDDLSPTLSGLALEAAALSRRGQKIDAEIAQMAEALNRGIQAAVAQTREIAYGLRPPVLDDQGLVAAIRSRLHGHQADQLQVQVQAPAGRLDLPAAVDLAALRIVQEAVTNVRRHAHAAHCVVALAKCDGELRLTVTDDGVGPPARIRDGLGLPSIHQRATELGGTAELAGGAEGGAVLSVRLPAPDGAR